MPLTPDQLNDALVDLRALRDLCLERDIEFTPNLIRLGQSLRDQVAAIALGRQEDSIELDPPENAAQMFLRLPIPAGVETLAEARCHIAAGWEQNTGTPCPICTQLVKLYKRRLNSSMARILIWLVRESSSYPDGWVPVSDTAPVFVRRSNEVSRLALWELVEDQPSDSPDRRNSGVWRPTERGRQFVACELSVPSHVHVFNNVIYGWSAELLDITSALGTSFSYAELMAGRFEPVSA